MVWLLLQSQRNALEKYETDVQNNNIAIIIYFLRPITDYLLTWIKNTSRTPNDRCAFEYYLWSIRTKIIN